MMIVVLELLLFFKQATTVVSSRCDEIKAEVAKKTHAYNALCSDGDPQLGKSCRVIQENIREREVAWKTLCPVVRATSCASLYNSGVKQDGIYTIDPDGQGSFQIRCDMTTDSGGWTVFQRRMDGSEDFNRYWSDYKSGFGNLRGEFWLGLDKLHRLTKSGLNVLRVDLTAFSDEQAYAKYNIFNVSGENDNYRLKVGSYSGTAGDSLNQHNGMHFSARDKDNDVWRGGSCAKSWKSAWWYKICHVVQDLSQLNGQYLGPGGNSWGGVVWSSWKSTKSLKKAEMKLRPKNY